MNFSQITIICSLFLLVIQPSYGDLESPRKQMEQGTLAQDVICKSGLELVIRTNGFAACVRPDTADKMQKIGMLIIPIKFTDLEKEFKSVSASEEEIDTVPASSMSIVNFYIKDQDLNVAHNGVEVISTQGLFEFTINGIEINGPQKMIETGPNTGEFYVRLELPETINGKPLSQEDIVLIKYLDESDFAGERRILVKSVPLTSTFAKVETFGGGSRIGHEFTLRIYEPDANRDSKDEDKIPLSSFEYRGDGGIRTTLANPKFDANSSSLIETGPNTSTFEVKIKIPRELDGKVIHIGDKYEIRYIDRSTPSGTDEKIILKGKIG
nr:hypothetical protein [Nitrosopumilus ureiphilus]